MRYITTNELNKKIESNSKSIEKEKERNDKQSEINNKIISEINKLSEIIKNKDNDITTKTKKIVDTQINNIKTQLKIDSKKDKVDNNLEEVNKELKELKEKILNLEEQKMLELKFDKIEKSFYDEDDEEKKIEDIKIKNGYKKNTLEKEKKYKLIINKNVFMFKEITKDCGSEKEEKELVDKVKTIFKNAVVEDDIIYEISTLCKDWDFDKYVKDKFNSVKRSRNIVKVNTNRLDTIYELQWSEKQIQFISKEATMKYVNNHGFFVKRGNSMIYVKRLNNSFKNYSRRKFFRYNKFSKKNNQKKNKFKNNNNNNLFNLNKNNLINILAKSVSEGLNNNRNINGKRIQYNRYKSTPFINRSINSYSGGYRRRPFINRKPYQFNNRRSYNNFGNNQKFIRNRNFRY